MNGHNGSELELKLWPVGDGNTYIETRNPYFLLKNFPPNEVPIKIISYRDETAESLEKVKEGAAKKLEFLYPSDFDRTLGNIGQSILSTIADVSILGVAYEGFTHSDPVSGLLGIGLTGAVTAITGAIYRKRRNEFNGKLNHVANNISNLTKTPVDAIKIEKDEELADIFNAIENKKPLKMLKPKDEESFSSIYNIIHGKFGSLLHGEERLPSRTREVYIQKIDAYHGRITRV